MYSSVQKKANSDVVIQNKESEASASFEDSRDDTLQRQEIQSLADNSSRNNRAYQLKAIADSNADEGNNPIPSQEKSNNTGLPDSLKSGIENLSGYSMDDVKVHYNSNKPAELSAHAYAQGSDIHLASGQEQHLPHEAWHVVQQKQGRVKPTMQMKDKTKINDDAGLEREADMMGAKAASQEQANTDSVLQQKATPNKEVSQRKVGRADGSKDLTIEEIEVWLTNTGVWGGVDEKTKGIINSMIDSGHQWMYSGMGAADLLLEAKELSKNAHYQEGLIHGDFNSETNEADFHVDPGDGGSLKADMLTVAQDVYAKMTAVSKLAGRPDGTVYLRPQGAAIIKIVSQLLGEALGNSEMIAVAHEHIRKRKTKEALLSYVPFYTKKMSKEVLDKTVVPEHLAYMYSLVGDSGVDIKPILVGNTFSADEFMQNMLENSVEGRARLEKYIKTLEDGKEAVSMNIYIQRSKLPAVISKLQG